MDPLQAKHIDILIRYLDFQTTLSLLFLTAIGSVVYYLWTKERIGGFKKAWVFAFPLICVLFSVYLIVDLYHSIIVDLQEGALSKQSVDSFMTFSWLQPSIMVLGLITLFIAMISARRR